MARPRKKPITTTQTRAEVIDKIFAQVDPVVAAAGLLSAAATYYGMTPPLTAMFGTIYNKEIRSDVADILTWSPVSAGLGMATGGGPGTSWADIITGNFGDMMESDIQKARRKQGMILIAAFEGMLLMSVARNEAALAKIMELGGKLGAATITAAGEAVPF
jgi:hypothetical protein